MARMKIEGEMSHGAKWSFTCPEHVAWVCAHAIAEKTHDTVILYGKRGIAEINPDGSGHVLWTEQSPEPGKVTTFPPNGTVWIN